MTRLTKFLNAEEVVPYVQRQNGVPAGAIGGGGGKVYPEDVCVSMKDCAFFWTGELLLLLLLLQGRWVHMCVVAAVDGHPLTAACLEVLTRA